MLFYMDVRYAGAGGVTGLEVIDEESHSGSCGGILHPVGLERSRPGGRPRAAAPRADRRVQGNRNPFVDCSEFAAAIWGAACGVN
jgi:hypothetical protein